MHIICLQLLHRYLGQFLLRILKAILWNLPFFYRSVPPGLIALPFICIDLAIPKEIVKKSPSFNEGYSFNLYIIYTSIYIIIVNNINQSEPYCWYLFVGVLVFVSVCSLMAWFPRPNVGEHSFQYFLSYNFINFLFLLCYLLSIKMIPKFMTLL